MSMPAPQTPPLAPAVRPSRLGMALAAGLALIAFAILIALGTWQMRRLAWKEDLLAKIDTRMHAAPVPLPPEADWPRLNPDDYEYRHVVATGVFEHDKEALIFRASGPNEGVSQPGYVVMTPLRLPDGAHVLVARGFVPEARKDPATRREGQVAGEVTVTGLLRAPESRNVFTPADDPAKGLWFTRDPALVARHFGLARMAPFSIDADPGPIPGGWPKAGVTPVDIPNNHLSYALTWYGLAATLALFCLYLLWRGRRA
jgi:surfeit locus 1 family protein